ncbi:helix-turn-helix domain-containing protein [Bacillus thuringiensis]|uniref:YdaS family helix-turn-helix protein n=1 Tax=Bacillus thuringiensis TaxID=1428 RepID=UPI001CD626D0|nr:YdaS family helix-turn-helix protein [Bacillus thuringiensis]MCA1001007.1 helix-turn-helix domain-containing protein [Bacillus thuringiensis]
MGVITIIGLEKVINVFNFNANKIAKEIGVNRQTVYDWLKGKRKIPKERIDQLTEIPEFKYVNKELFQKEIDNVDEIDIEIARTKYRSDMDSEEVEDEFYGIPVTHDPYAQDRQLLYKMKEIVQEIERAKSMVFDMNYLEGLNSSIGENYVSALSSLNDVFEQTDVNKIKIIVVFLSLLNNKELTDKSAQDLREMFKKYISASGKDSNVYDI